MCAGNGGYIVTSFRTLLFYNEIKIAHILPTLAHPCCCPAMGKHGSTEKIYYFPLVHFIFISLTHISLAALSEIAWKLPSFPAEFLIHIAGAVHTLDKQLEAQRWTGEGVREKARNKFIAANNIISMTSIYTS